MYKRVCMKATTEQDQKAEANQKTSTTRHTGPAQGNAPTSGMGLLLAVPVEDREWGLSWLMMCEL